MIHSFKSLRFKFPWRKYQEGFLDHFEEHIKDGHLHVIAPPGSGKTLLGLEILRQIGEKTLVLSPTLTIRNQWEDRLQTFFTSKGDFEQTSFDLKETADITFSTYQGLYAFYKKQKDESCFLDYFKKAGVKTIVLDEAHHLKNAWWKCLFALKEDQDLTIVALTATPPFDSSQQEIKRYFELCGEVDDEIAVPSLVKEGDLCPHQDFVHFSLPDELTINHIVSFRMMVAQLLDDLKEDTDFIDRITQHRFYANTLDNLDQIYKNPSVFSGYILFLNAINIAVPREKLEILGFDKKEAVHYPEFTLKWAEIILNHLLFDDKNLYLEDAYMQSLSKKLKRLGVLKTNRVDLVGNDTFYKTLSSSPSKLKSIVEITKESQKQQQGDLRMVVLTDYIRKEFLDSKQQDATFLKLGVVPIFNSIRSELKESSKIAVLTGSLVIVSQNICAIIVSTYGSEAISVSPLENDNAFVCIRSTSKSSASLVEIITKLFQEGSVNILIGTKSLLGEGWDAPAINTLILASSVGSFVTSNQMRGRAIRTFKQDPNKTAVVWHLACLDPSDDNGGSDLSTLSRRFTAFMGISNNQPLRIENGIDRLDIKIPKTLAELKTLNAKSIAQSDNRDTITLNWNKAITTGNVLTRKLKQFYDGKVDYIRQKRFYFKDVVRVLLIEIILGVSYFVPELLLKNINVLLQGGWIKFIYILISALFLGYGVKAFRVIRLLVKHGNLHKDIYKIGIATLETLMDLGYINTPRNITDLDVNMGANGIVSCIPIGMSNYESTLFINALEEVIAPIDNPRYLLQRKEWYRNLLGIQRCYVVPTIVGDKKEKSERFLFHWKKNLGKAFLIYTRQQKGRRILLKARLFHISNTEEKNTKKMVVWH